MIGVAVGTVLGVVAKSKLDQSNSGGHCDAADTCDGPGLGLRQQRRVRGHGGDRRVRRRGILVAGGAVLWFTGAAQRRKRIGSRRVRAASRVNGDGRRAEG